jgi:hypothetical protein
MNLQAMKEAALKATPPNLWTEKQLAPYLSCEGHNPDAVHIANCDPQTILKMIAVVEASNGYVNCTEDDKVILDRFYVLKTALKELK